MYPIIFKFGQFTLCVLSLTFRFKLLPIFCWVGVVSFLCCQLILGDNSNARRDTVIDGEDVDGCTFVSIGTIGIGSERTSSICRNIGNESTHVTDAGNSCCVCMKRKLVALPLSFFFFLVEIGLPY